jgi:hypothetical protein
MSFEGPAAKADMEFWGASTIVSIDIDLADDNIGSTMDFSYDAYKETDLFSYSYPGVRECQNS